MQMRMGESYLPAKTRWYNGGMPTAKIIKSGRFQAVRLPLGIRFDGDSVSVHREGDRVVIEPLKARRWPKGFFEAIRITDADFTRPPQGKVPPAPAL